MAPRRRGAGRVNFITAAVNAQRTLAQVSAGIYRMRAQLEDDGVALTEEQKSTLSDARAFALNAADGLHKVAIQLLHDAREERVEG